jgi:hypothetical protein
MHEAGTWIVEHEKTLDAVLFWEDVNPYLEPPISNREKRSFSSTAYYRREALESCCLATAWGADEPVGSSARCQGNRLFEGVL